MTRSVLGACARAKANLYTRHLHTRDPALLLGGAALALHSRKDDLLAPCLVIQIRHFDRNN